MKYFIILFLSLFYSNSFAYEFFCKFVKKVDSMSDFQVSEIENSEFEENQNLLKIINKPLVMKIYDQEIRHIINLGNSISIVDYFKIKEDDNKIISFSKKGNFFMFFNRDSNKLIFSEFHDATHNTGYFYNCTKK